MEITDTLGLMDAFHLGERRTELETELEEGKNTPLRAIVLKEEIAIIDRQYEKLGYWRQKFFEVGRGFEF